MRILYLMLCRQILVIRILFIHSEPVNLDGVVIAESVNLEASIMATVICKEIGVPYVVVKTKNERHAEILKKIGADAVDLPGKGNRHQACKKSNEGKLCRLDCTVARLQYCGIRSSESMDRQELERVGYT